MKLLFATSPIGLGHASRDVSLALELKSKVDIIKFISGYPASTLIRDYGFSVFDVYRPPNFNVREGELKGTTSWILKYWLYYRRCRKAIASIIREHKVDAVISDEDFASIVEAKSIGLPCVLITDLLRTSFARNPLAAIIERKMNQGMVKIIQDSDIVLIPDYGEDIGKIRFVGPIVRSTPEKREELRIKFNFHKKTILVTGGGTDSARFLFHRTIEVFKKLNQDEHELVIVSGPNVNLQVALPQVRVFGYVPDLQKMIYACDLIITQGGRSTMDEARCYGTPYISIPIKNHFEQEENSRRSGFTFKDIHRLEEVISAKLLEKRPDATSCDPSKAVDAISNLLDL